MIAIAYWFNVPEHRANRMGRDGTLYEIAQWYPRWPSTTGLDPEASLASVTMR